MKKLSSTLFLTITIMTSYGQEIGKNFIDQNYIEVTGYAEKLITPNQIYLKISINEKDFRGKTLPEIEKLMMGKLKELGVDIEKDLEIKDFISNFQHYWILKSSILLIKEYQLLVYDAKTAGQVFIELEKLGISNISIDRLNHNAIGKYRQEVKIESIKSAKEEAIALSTAVGQDIGRALYIIENHTENVNMAGVLQGKAAGVVVRSVASSGIYGSRASEPNVDFEKIRLEYHITVRFELK